MNWKAPGTFRGSKGIWELGINPKTRVIYHLNFVTSLIDYEIPYRIYGYSRSENFNI